MTMRAWLRFMDDEDRVEEDLVVHDPIFRRDQELRAQFGLFGRPGHRERVELIPREERSCEH